MIKETKALDHPATATTRYLRSAVRNLVPLTDVVVRDSISKENDATFSRLDGERPVDLAELINTAMIHLLFHPPQTPKRQAALDFVIRGLQHMAELSSYDNDCAVRLRESGQRFDEAINAFDLVRGKT